jgi:3-isopropylmalate dehydrogenase
MGTYKIVFLPGDGIGPEVVGAAAQVLGGVASRFGLSFETETRLIGGGAIDATGQSLPEETLGACLEADAVLLGAVGGPKWDDPTAAERPERGLLGLRTGMQLFANLRPVKPDPALLDASPLKRERLEGVDLLVVRELTGGIYFGTPRERRSLNGEVQAVDTMLYSESEIRRVLHVAFQAARARRSKVTSVDKANVLETSRLWRQVARQVADEYPDVAFENLLVDAAAMHLLTRPADFDVIVTGNMFGDILTDEASVLAGSMGVLPSASLGDGANRHGLPRGLYEPIHGSAPDIAGKGVANPTGTVISLAMLLRHSLGMENEARAVEEAVAAVIGAGHRTADLAGDGRDPLDTQSFTELFVNEILEGAPVGPAA